MEYLTHSASFQLTVNNAPSNSGIKHLSYPGREGRTGMKTTRKRYTGEFKAKVALEAIRGELTLAELAAKHGIHPTMIATWKRQAIEGMAATFSGTAEASKAAGEAELEKLHAKIGQLVVERDFLSKGFAR
jgi:transposase